MRLAFYCSTPNFRGIHQYCLYISRLATSFASVVTSQPCAPFAKKKPPLHFLYQLIWELLPGHPSSNRQIEIFASPRLPLRYLFEQNNNPICGAVVLDFIQCIDQWSPYSLWSLYKSYGFLELIKRVIHTFHFNISLRRLDFIINISHFTESSLQRWSAEQYRRLSDHSLVLHPSPSFSPASILDSLQTLPLLIDTSVFRIHIVTGNSPSKQPLLLEQCLSSLKSNGSSRFQRFEINIFGYSSLILEELSCNDFIVNCHYSYTEERFLIQSSLLANLFFSTSREEGFGIPLLDSLLFDMKCICTPIEPFREICNNYDIASDQVFFTSSCDNSLIDEFVSTVMSAALIPHDVNPVKRASIYVHKSRDIETCARIRLENFLSEQLT
jgi:hypothetical protein